MKEETKKEISECCGAVPKTITNHHGDFMDVCIECRKNFNPKTEECECSGCFVREQCICGNRDCYGRYCENK